MAATSIMAAPSIAIILKAAHRPDRGQYGACTRCLHGDASGQVCHRFGSKPTSSHTMRSHEGACGDGHLFEHQPNPNHHPAQIALI